MPRLGWKLPATSTWRFCGRQIRDFLWEICLAPCREFAEIDNRPNA